MEKGRLFCLLLLPINLCLGELSGLFPSVFNLAETAAIIANATCGERNSEVYCKLDLLGNIPPSNQECGICDATERGKAHPIGKAIDGQTGSWWQAPSLQFGPDYHFVTITVDLKKVFQVGYILMQSGISPRPGNWILERSLDGVEWAPWQFFAVSDEECWRAFGVEPRRGKPSYRYDDEVICTSYFSALDPVQDGEIHVSLVNGRPGASGPSRTLTEFTLARYIRIRFRRLRILPQDQSLVQGLSYPDTSVLRRYFYSLQDLTIGGQCPCNGHAGECKIDLHASMDYQCQCRHNTCGPLCNQCCPMYNQKLWRPGKFISANECERCQCFGHADECFFDPQVEAERKSLNTEGQFEGGGVCLDCRHHTAGINCQYCKEGYYRPQNVSQFDPRPCLPCQCHGLQGSLGTCYNNAEAEKLGVSPGQCVCREGFAGPRCQQCARGYHQYPDCQPCPCTLAGTLNGACSGLCQCKAHVEGHRCDRCKRGFFALHPSHSEGCLQCFCNGITDQCETADLGVEVLEHSESWKVTDLRGSLVVEPYWSTVTNGITIAEEDMQGLETYFWQAPQEYIGNRLVVYGLKIKIKTSWHTGRGDTAGTSTLGPDIIIQGLNGMVIGCGMRRYRGLVNASMIVEMSERNWYHIPQTLYNIEAKSYNDERPSFKGKTVTKIEFMQVIGQIARFLVRAKYHTDQLESTLYTAAMEFGSQESLSLKKTTGIEQCLCPPGYQGLSCEECSYGYVRVNNTIYQGECMKCDCNGHAATCDPFTLRCGICQHNTAGQRCESCAQGFYGNPLRGTPNDCKPCKCPLEVASNNFSPTCLQATLDYDRYSIAPESYICDACPRGYAGPHCGRCDNGYFGNPLEIGNFCQPCYCNGNGNIYLPNWCDSITGQCLECLGNTGGDNCQNCLEGFFGNPLSGQCKACDCNVYGSLGPACEVTTGQCQCRDKYIGRTCSQCEDGFGNVAAGCRQCNCNSIGSLLTDVCDADSGQCQCRPGITGLTCDQCLPLHYGFGNLELGCQACNCNVNGSHNALCDLSSGQCQCQPHVEGRRCERCIFGYWNIDSGQGCQKCQCDPMGAYNEDCDDETGQCRCKPGIGGASCDKCLVGYWGFSPRGCTKCFPCDQPGHICDPDTGRCICPPLTQGPACQSCQPGTWSYDNYKGCKYCDCHRKGSVSEQCDLNTGQCPCVEGYEGNQCNKCSPGHYKFPHCWPCNCDLRGTNHSSCNVKDQNGKCSCDDQSGACLCKSLVEGKKCGSCRPGTFGLSAANDDGCITCFCFGRTNLCRQADRVWSRLSSMDTRRKLRITRGQTTMEVSQGLLLIPNDQGDVVIGVERLFTTPLYWSMPTAFLGEKVTSYNGYFRFSTSSNGKVPPASSMLHPLIQLQAADQEIILEHYPAKLSSSGRYEVHLEESQWVKHGSRLPVSRALLMVALQRLERVMIRATDFTGATIANLHGVTLDVAVERNEANDNRPVAIGVEKCTCPPQYNGTSCQDPGRGFYRWYSEFMTTTTTYLHLAGDVKSCQCNGRAQNCHPETGRCIGCSQNTTGSACELCAAGYYGNPLLGSACRPCQCPSAENNHAATCRRLGSGSNDDSFMCQCKEGYTGPSCDRCDYGYYGNSQDGCWPCRCNAYGSVGNQCHQETGQCACVRGVTGRDCSQCPARQVLVRNGQCRNCDVPCVASLLDSMDAIRMYYDNANVSDIDPAPMIRVVNYQQQLPGIDAAVEEVKVHEARIEANLASIQAMKPHAELTLLEVNKYDKAAEKQEDEAQNLFEQGRQMADEAHNLEDDINEVIRNLQSYGKNDDGAGAQVEVRQALAEARGILATIKGRSYAQMDITVRTELSYARQALNSVKELLLDQQELQQQGRSLERIEVMINDLLKYLNRAMDQTRQAFLANDQYQAHLNRAQSTCATIRKLHQGSLDMSGNTAEALLRQANRINGDATSAFGRLQTIHDRLVSVEKILRSKESGLSELVENYRINQLQPCQAHASRLQRESQKVLNMLGRDLGHGAEKTLEAANAYQNIMRTVRYSRRAADRARQVSQELAEKAQQSLNAAGYDLFAQADTGRVKSRDLRQEAEGLRQNSREMQVQMEELILRWQSYILLVSKKQRDLQDVTRDLEGLQIVSVLAEEAVRQSQAALQNSLTVHGRVSDLFQQISLQLWGQVRELQSFSPEQLGNIPRKLTEARRQLQQVNKQATYLSHRRLDIESLSQRVGNQIKDLKSKIAMARHAADSVQISITNQRLEHPEASAWGCSRSYRVNLTSSMSTKLSVIYALNDVEESDGLIAYLPRGQPGLEMKERDFMALQLVNRQVRFSWNNGAGTTFITHNTTIGNGINGREPVWYRITAERVGHIGRLNVRTVKALYVSADDNRWVVGEAAHPEANVLNLHRADLLYIGGGAIPDSLRSSLSSTEDRSGFKFTGVLSQLEVNERILGLWNFVTSAGCRETHSAYHHQEFTAAGAAGIAGVGGFGGTSSSSDCFSFYGDGYAVQQGIRNYDARYLAVSLEFKSFDADALLFYAVNEYTRQHLLLELRDGRIFMELHYGPEKQLAFLTSHTYNGGGWVKVEAARALRNNVETGVLRVVLNGVHEDLMDTIALPNGVAFQMEESLMFVGGVPPDYHSDQDLSFTHLHRQSLGSWQSFLGQMRAITMSNPGSNSLLNPLYTQRHKANPYYGVVSRCDRHTQKMASFQGEAYIEVPSQPLRRLCTFGFSFQTFTTNALLLLSTFVGKTEAQKDFYSVSLIDGRLALKFGSSSNGDTTFVTKEAFNDGAGHTLSVTKSNDRIDVFIDDNLVSQEQGVHLDGSQDISAPTSGGLYIGGIPFHMKDFVEKSGSVSSINGFVGTISDLSFIDELSVRVIDFNQPETLSRALVGRRMHFPSGQPDWPIVIPSVSLANIAQADASSSSFKDCSNQGTKFNGESFVPLNIHHQDELEVSLGLNWSTTRNEDIILSVPLFSTGVKRRRKWRKILVALKCSKDKLCLKVMDERGRSLRSIQSQSILSNDGNTTEVGIRIQGQSLFLYLENQFETSMKMPKKARPYDLLYIGGVPLDMQRKLSLGKGFSGCLEHIKLNGQLLSTSLLNRQVQGVPLLSCHSSNCVK